jgi:uncharacterized protein (DUF2147 family)
MKALIYTLALSAALSFVGTSRANDEQDKTWMVNGKVTVISKDSITVGDHLYKIGDSTRVKKDGERVRLKDLKVGDYVLVDTRGKDEVDGEISRIIVLTPSEAKQYREKTVIREKEKTHETTEEHE